MDDLFWPLGWVSHGECTSVCDAHWTGPTMNHDSKLLIVMIHQTTILHELSTLRGYWVNIKIKDIYAIRNHILEYSYPIQWDMIS